METEESESSLLTECKRIRSKAKYSHNDKRYERGLTSFKFTGQSLLD